MKIIAYLMYLVSLAPLGLYLTSTKAPPWVYICLLGIVASMIMYGYFGAEKRRR